MCFYVAPVQGLFFLDDFCFSSAEMVKRIVHSYCCLAGSFPLLPCPPSSFLVCVWGVGQDIQILIDWNLLLGREN